MYEKLKYYFNRIKEAPLSSIITILLIRFKKIIFFFYYNRFLHPIFNSFSDKLEVNDNINLEKNLGLSQNRLSKEPLYHDVINGTFQCLGYGKLKIPNNSEWLSDNLHNYKWKMKYFNNIDYVSSNNFCDVKIPWEMSRLQYLVILAYSFIETKDKKNLDRYCLIINDWIKSNPPGYGVNWTCTMEVSIRMINIAISFMTIKNHLSKKQIKIINRSLSDHKKYISFFPELSDVPGNHYLSNLMGEFVIESISGRQEKTDEKLKKFLKEAKNQFLSDGGHFEMSPTYHIMCLEMVAVVIAFALRLKTKNDGTITSLENIYRNGVAFCDKIGNSYEVPIFGDNDSGQIISLDKKTRNYKSLKQFLNIIENKPLESHLDYHNILLLSITNIDQINTTIKNRKKTRALSFKGHCFMGLKVNNLSAVMRYGLQGLKQRASHDHDDALHVNLSKDGKDILVDKGCHSYTLDQKIREEYILSSAHNSLKEIGKERFYGGKGSIVKTVRGALVGNNPSCFDNKLDEAEMTASLKENKYSNFKKNERNVNMIYSKSKYELCITDIWELKKNAGVELKYFFSTLNRPKIIDKINKNEILLNFENKKIKVSIKSDNFVDVKIFTFNYSRNYGSKEKSYGINILSKQKSGIIKTNFLIDC